MRSVRRWVAAVASLAVLTAPNLAVRGSAQEKEPAPKAPPAPLATPGPQATPAPAAEPEKKEAPPAPDFAVRVTGYAHLDGRFFASGGGAILGTDTFVLRRVRPSVQGTVARFVDFSIVPDFGGGTVVLQDAYLDARYVPWLRVRIGKFKAPVGLERLQSATNLAMVERGLPTSINPNRDLGLQVHGEVAKGVLLYAVAVVNGVTDGASADLDLNDGKDVAGRLFLSPFKGSSVRALKDLGVGIAGTTGQQEGVLTPIYRTSGQQIFFAYSLGVSAAGKRTRLTPQASYQAGPMRAFGEYARSRQRLRSATVTQDVTNHAWQATASYVLTGEVAAAGVVTPRRPFEPGKGGWGALELVGRYGALEVGDEAFRAALADPTRFARKAQAWAVGINWYLSRYLKQVVNFERTTFTGGAAAGNRAPENLIVFRTQIAY